MSFIDDIPFDGDNSTPLTESLKKRITAAELSYKNRSSFDIDLTPADLRFYEFIAEGNTSAQKSAEEAELEAELNRVRLEVEINANRRRMQQKQDKNDKQQAVVQTKDLYIEKESSIKCSGIQVKPAIKTTKILNEISRCLGNTPVYLETIDFK